MYNVWEEVKKNFLQPYNIRIDKCFLPISTDFRMRKKEIRMSQTIKENVIGKSSSEIGFNDSILQV